MSKFQHLLVLPNLAYYMVEKEQSQAVPHKMMRLRMMGEDNIQCRTSKNFKNNKSVVMSRIISLWLRTKLLRY
jgi:hypothetical protein